MPEMNRVPTGRPWRGLLASIFLWGAGQFFAGARCRGLIWLVIGIIGPVCLFALYSMPLLPAKAAVFLALIWVGVWLTMAIDSWRPIIPLGWWGWILLIAASLLFSGAISSLTRGSFHAFRVPTRGMAPTIAPGDNVLVSRFAYWFQAPKRGDLIVFRTSGIPLITQNKSTEEVMYVKRLVGLPGDRIEIGGGQLFVNNAEMNFGDSAHPIRYVAGGGQMVDPDANSPSKVGSKFYTVPEQKYFVLGDNSGQSYDSRYFGGVPIHALYGKVTKIYWPWSRMSTLR